MQNPSGEADSNHDLCLQILARHSGVADHTRVENGDIEELLILEPVMAEIRDAASRSRDEILACRNGKKLSQLARIERDNRSHHETIQTRCTARKKHFRITGNHHRDMRSQAFVDVVRDAGGVDYIICHGHQFDSSCTQRHAAKLGETYTQGGAWAYRGPDRVWRQSKDPIAGWRPGGRPVQNELVTDLPTDHETVLEALGSLNSESGREKLYGKNIARECYDNASAPGTAIKDEVETGDRWFKFRHMNEFRIVAVLENLFAGTPTRLILGHSHGPRFHPGISLTGQPHRCLDGHLNCALAGRF